MWNGVNNTESSGSVVLRSISRPSWLPLSLTVLFSRMQGNGRVSEEPLKRSAETRMCATTQLCICTCSSWRGYWFLLIRNSWLLERVSLWGPVIRPEDVIHCFVSSWSHVRKHVTSARLCCFKHLRVVSPTSHSDGGRACLVKCIRALRGPAPYDL